MTKTIKTIRKLDITDRDEVGNRAKTFPMKLRNVLGNEFVCIGSLHCGYEKRDDGILWIMQHAAVIASSHSPEQIAERQRMWGANAERPVQNGDVVNVKGRRYIVKVKGDYSDCAVLVREK
jgi:hypothetical protein